MEVICRTEGKGVLVTAFGEKTLSVRNSREFSQTLIALAQGHPRVVLDLAEVLHVDGVGLGTLLACVRQLVAGGASLVLCGLTAPVRAVLEPVCFHQVVPILNSRSEAVVFFDCVTQQMGHP